MSGFVIMVDFRLKPGAKSAFRRLIDDNARASCRNEPGCRRFDVMESPGEADRIVLYEIYDDEKAFEAHQQTPHFKKYLAEAVPLLAARERQVWKRALP